MQAKFSLLAYAQGHLKTVPTKNGTATPPPGATRFYLRYTDETGKRHTEPIGDGDLLRALAEIRTREARAEYEKKTGEKLPGGPAAREPQKKTSLAAEIDAFLDLKRMTPGIAPSTVTTYRLSLALFLDFATAQKICASRDFKREDLFRYAARLRDLRNVHDELRFRPLSVYCHFANALVFLKAQNVHLKIPMKQWGKPAPRKPQSYTDEQLDDLFFVATPEEGLLFKSFLFSGLRNQELAHLTYGDINFKTSVWTVETKDNWETKSTDSVRRVPVPAFHTKDIAERMRDKRATESDLIFPAGQGQVHTNYLQLLKKLARRAKLTGRVDIHKFRSTAATIWLRDGVDVLEVARRLGHNDLKTIRQYIEAIDLESTETMERTTKAFRRFDTMRSK